MQAEKTIDQRIAARAVAEAHRLGLSYKAYLALVGSAEVAAAWAAWESANKASAAHFRATGSFSPALVAAERSAAVHKLDVRSTMRHQYMLQFPE